MCGIFGISGHPSAAALTHLGLYSLQHRGQESAGIVAVDGEQVRAIRAMGLVSDKFSADTMSTLTGAVAIGHTRYSTAGSSTIDNAQPKLVHFRGGHIALAHNGNLTNAAELKDALEAEGSIFSSSADSEVIVHRLAKARATAPEAQLAEALDGVEGAYSLLVAIGETLLAARDPYGWRPLVMGRLNGATVFASESCALDIVGAVAVREVAPAAAGACGWCHRARPRTACVRAPPGAGTSGPRCGLRLLGARLVELCGPRVRRGQRSPARTGADPQPLCWTHVHPAHAAGAR
ncbi:MAG: hypothetical protein RLZZ467_1039 [Gemmatimonadota bacterium]